MLNLHLKKTLKIRNSVKVLYTSKSRQRRKIPGKEPMVKFTGCKFKSLYLQTSVFSYVKKVSSKDFLNSKKIRIKQLPPFTILVLFMQIFCNIRGFSFFLIPGTVNCEGILTNLFHTNTLGQSGSGNRKLLREIPV